MIVPTFHPDRVALGKPLQTHETETIPIYMNISECQTKLYFTSQQKKCKISIDCYRKSLGLTEKYDILLTIFDIENNDVFNFFREQLIPITYKIKKRMKMTIKNPSCKIYQLQENRTMKEIDIYDNATNKEFIATPVIEMTSIAKHKNVISFNYKIKELHISHGDYPEKDICPICYQLPEGNSVILACYHSFCVECISSWFHIKKCCPLCRSIVSLDDVITTPKKESGEISHIKTQSR